MSDNGYEHIRSGGSGIFEHKRGLIAVWGKESVRFLDGLITNDIKTLADGGEMIAAFPNAQGRLLAVVRVLRQGDRFLFETEEATREMLFANLFKFTYAGDFFVEDLSDKYTFFYVIGNFDPVELFVMGIAAHDPLVFEDSLFPGVFVSSEFGSILSNALNDMEIVSLSDVAFETLRIENGIPRYGIDMDETTIVPELGLDGLISYNKGCYIGQEIIARIHFRGHVAKRLTGLVLDQSGSEPGAIATGFQAGAELTTGEGKNTGRITSVTYSPNLDKVIALAFVRYDFLAAGTELRAGETNCTVTDLPFIS